MNWEEVRTVTINGREGMLWKAKDFGQTVYSVTLYEGDMIRLPRGYMKSSSHKEAIAMAKLREKR